MRIFVALCMMSAVVYLFLLGSLWRQNRKSPSNRALRLFTLGLLAWLCVEMMNFLPVSYGREYTLQRLASLFWVTASMLFMNFVYVLLQRRRDAFMISLSAVVLVAAALFALTDLGMTSAVREEWGGRGIPGVGYWPLVIVAASPGPHALMILWRHFQSPDQRALRPAIRMIVISGACALTSALGVNAVLPVFLGIHGIPQVAPAMGSLVCVFVTVAIVKHDFLAVSLEQVAQELFERLPEGVVLVDREGEVRSMNRRALDMLGLAAPLFQARDLPGCAEGLEAGERQILLEVEGEPRQLLVSVSEHRSAEQHIGFILAYRDVSEEYRIERRIAEESDALEAEVEHRSRNIEQARSRETLGMFAGSVIHDFNNQLFPIIGLSELVLERFDPGDPRAFDMQEVLRAATKAADVGRKLLSFTRAGSTKRTLVDLVKLVEEIGYFLRASVPAGVKVEVNVEAAEVFVVGVAGALRQMIVNVAVNAVEALLPCGGTISLGLRRETLSNPPITAAGKTPPGPIALDVQDDGVGLPPGIVEEVFRPFFTTKGAQGRAGLGLAVAAHIAAEHGGYIELSPAPRQGTVVSIRLPGLLRTSWVEFVANQPELLGSERVLIAASSTETEEELKAALLPLGYQLFVMADALKAARVLRADPTHYDLLLIDGGTLGEVTELVNAVHRHRTGLAVLVVTSSSEEAQRLRFENLQVETVTKPLLPGGLASAVRRALSSPYKA